MTDVNLPKPSERSKTDPDKKNNDSAGVLVPVIGDFAKRLRAISQDLPMVRSFELPAELDQRVLETVRGGGVQLVTGILSDKELVDKLLKTKIWKNEEDLTDALNAIAFGQPNDETIMRVRQVSQTLKAGDQSSHVVEVVADLLLDRRLNAPQFMAIADEMLRKTDPLLAENLDSLLKGNSDIQYRAFQWLFDTMMKHCEAAVMNDTGKERHLITSRIIFKQISRVLSEDDQSRWLGLQSHIIMRFAERIAEETRIQTKPLISALIAFDPRLSQDFILAVDTCFSKIAREFHTPDQKESEKTGKILKHYGGFENYAQGIETVLSFGTICWPDNLHNYFLSRFPHSTNLMQSQYLNCMKFALHQRDSERNIVGFHEDRLSFVLENVIRLSDNPYFFVQSRLNEVLDFVVPNGDQHVVADQMVATLCDGNLYQSLSEKKRSFLVEFLLRTSDTRVVPNCRERVLPQMMFEVELTQNIPIQGKIFYAEYFNHKILELLSKEQAQSLRSCILTGYTDFSRNDILTDRICEVLKYYGLRSVEEAFTAFETNIATNYERAAGLLNLSARIASDLTLSSESELRTLGIIIEKLCALAKRAGQEKVEGTEDYYAMRTRVSGAQKELEGLEQETALALASARAINSKVEELDSETRDLESDKIELSASLRHLDSAQHAGYMHESDIASDMKKRPWRELLPWAKSNDPSKPTWHQLRRNLNEARHASAEYAREVAQAKGKIAKIDKRLKEMEPEKAEAQKQQAAMSEGATALQKRKEKLNLFVKNAELSLDTLKTLIERDLKHAQAYHEALRLYLKSPSITPQLAKEIDNSLVITIKAPKQDEEAKPARVVSDGQMLLTRFTLALDTRFSSVLELRQIIDDLTKLIHFQQSKRGLSKIELGEEVRCFVDAAESGILLPTSKEDPIFSLMQSCLRENRFLQDTIAQQGVVASRMLRARNHHKAVQKEVIDEVRTLLGTGTANLLPPLKDFLRSKFGQPTEHGERDTVEILIIIFVVVAVKQGFEEAIENLFYNLAIPNGNYSAKPEEGEAVAVNRAQTIDRRYGRYYKSFHNLRQQIYNCNQDSFRLQEGLGWDEVANGLALRYFATVFQSDLVPKMIRKEAELTLLNLALLPWTKQEAVIEKEQEDKDAKDLEVLLEAAGYQSPKKPKEKPPEKIAASEYSIYESLRIYLNDLDFINNQSISESTENHGSQKHDPRLVVEFAYNFAKKIITHINRVNPHHLNLILSSIESLKSAIASEVAVEDKGAKVQLRDLLDEALAVIRPKLGIMKDNEFIHAALPFNRERYSLPRLTPPEDPTSSDNLELDL